MKWENDRTSYLLRHKELNILIRMKIAMDFLFVSSKEGDQENAHARFSPYHSSPCASQAHLGSQTEEGKGLVLQGKGEAQDSAIDPTSGRQNKVMTLGESLGKANPEGEARIEHIEESSLRGSDWENSQAINARVLEQMAWELKIEHRLSPQAISRILHVEKGWVEGVLKLIKRRQRDK